MTEPKSDYQSYRGPFPWSTGEDRRDQQNDYIAHLRSDATNANEVIIPDNYYVPGNPDAFGPNPPMVQEDPNRPAGAIPLPIYRTGVYREE
jgi:hypothetical protein